MDLVGSFVDDSGSSSANDSVNDSVNSSVHSSSICFLLMLILQHKNIN